MSRAPQRIVNLDEFDRPEFGHRRDSGQGPRRGSLGAEGPGIAGTIAAIPAAVVTHLPGLVVGHSAP